MAMFLTRWRMITAAIGLLCALYGFWRVHDALAEQRVRRAVAALQAQTERQTREQVEAELREQLQQRHDAEMAEQARRAVAAADYSQCPDVPAGYFRMLNAIGKAEPAPGDPSD